MEKALSTFILIVASGIVALFWASSLHDNFESANWLGQIVQSKEEQNSTIKLDRMESSVQGVTDADGNIQYDGEISAAEVIDEITESDEQCMLFLDGVLLNAKSYKGIPLLEYMRNYDAMILYDSSKVAQALQDGKKYSRVYTQDSAGNITQIHYRRI